MLNFLWYKLAHREFHFLFLNFGILVYMKSFINLRHPIIILQDLAW